jgi:hypothetical protein
MNPVDGRALGAQCDVDGQVITEETKAAARRIIAANAAGDTLAEQVADATELMMALGVHPSQKDEEFLEEETVFMSCSRGVTR